MVADRIYYEAVRAIPLAQRVAILARQRIFALFMRRMRPTPSTTIVDVGTSEEEGPEANFLEKLYPWPEQITCTARGDGTAIKLAHPKVQFVSIKDAADLPFESRSFDIAYSSAVLEHVGGPSQRRAVIDEACRIGRSVFFAVPNGWFPVEHHTGLPLLHWSPALFRKALANGKRAFWSDPNNLQFLSKGRLGREFPDLNISYAGLWLGPLSSNLAIVEADSDSG